jgi:hypothetical protein
MFPEIFLPLPYDFYDNHLSLSTGLHNIQMISPVFEDWKKASEDPSCRTILITHRIEELRESVMSILHNYEVEFDETYFLGRVTEKRDTLAKEIESLPELKDILIYEDSMEQILKYGKLTSSLEDINVKYYFVDKSKVFELDEAIVGESRRIKLL